MCFNRSALHQEERSCWQNLTYSQKYQLSKTAVFLYCVTNRMNPQTLKIDFFFETLKGLMHNVGGKDRAHRSRRVSSCNRPNPKPWKVKGNLPKDFSLWTSFTGEGRMLIVTFPTIWINTKGRESAFCYWMWGWRGTGGLCRELPFGWNWGKPPKTFAQEPLKCWGSYTRSWKDFTTAGKRHCCHFYKV